MSPETLILGKLRGEIALLEEAPRRFSRVIPVAEPVDRILPYGGLPAGCIHEVKGTTLATALAFSAILAARLAGEGRIVYLASDRRLYPLGLLPYGVNLSELVLVSARRSRDLAWAVMEALRCPQVSAVLAVMSGLDSKESRRLQIAAEGSKTTGFLLGDSTSAPIASVITRWKIAPVPGKLRDRFDEPLWEIDLVYCRGGRPQTWVLEWRDQKLNALARPAVAEIRKLLAG
jgi:protein ImuA